MAGNASKSSRLVVHQNGLPGLWGRFDPAQDRPAPTTAWAYQRTLGKPDRGLTKSLNHRRVINRRKTVPLADSATGNRAGWFRIPPGAEALGSRLPDQAWDHSLVKMGQPPLAGHLYSPVPHCRQSSDGMTSAGARRQGPTAPLNLVSLLLGNFNID